MALRIFIDGMNVVRGNPSPLKIEEREGNAAARRELVRLVGLHAGRAEPAEWTIVFDGPGRDGADKELADGLLVVYAGARTADEVIVELASDSVALGHATRIVSSDRRVRCRGAEAVNAQEFYEDLIRRPAAEPAPPREDGRAAALLQYLAAAGHLPKPLAADARLIAGLAAEIEYFAHGAVADNKMARKIETSLRASAALSPDPDPQKAVLRAIKEFFRGSAVAR